LASSTMFFGGGGFPFEGMGGGGRPRGNVDNSKLYETLGVAKDASDNDIRRSYLKLSKTHHPDKGGDPEKFKEISMAHDILSDKQKRAAYDRGGLEAVEGGGGGGGGADDIFSAMFGGGGGGGGSRGRKRTKDVVQPLKIPLEQMYNGATKKMAINREVLDKEFGIRSCDSCDGRGVKVQVVRMGPMIQQMQSPCDRCGGQGKSFRTKKEREILEVHIQKGAPDGHKVTFRDKADEHPDADPGDVHFVLKEQPHTTFKRKGADLFVERTISLVEALCGFDMEITHLDGRKLLVKTGPGEIIRPSNGYDPLASNAKEAEWEVFEDSDCPGLDTVAKAEIADVEKCKEASIGQLKRKGIDVCCFVTRNGETEFKQGTRSECIANIKSKKGSTTYVIPCPEASSALRMMKAVKGEGMPTLRNPFVHGNLFLLLTIDFPESLSPSAQAALKKELPPPLNSCMHTDEHENHTLVDMDPVVSEQENKINMGSGNEAYDEDDEGQGGMGGGQRVQCAQQ